MNLQDDKFFEACFELDSQNQWDSKSQVFLSILRQLAARLFIYELSY